MRRILVATIFSLSLISALLPLHSAYRVDAAVSEGERLSMYCKPAVVKLWVGPYGSFYYQPPKWSQGKTYQVNYVVTGSGFFINPNGYIATNAHVTQQYHDGEDKGKENLFQQYLQQVAKDYNVDPHSLTQDNINYIAQYTRLVEFNMLHHVVIPDGSAFPFEIKNYGAPVGEGENWKDVSIVKIEVKNAPTLVFGDSDKVQLQDHVTVIGYPGAGDVSYPNILNSKSQLEASITDGKVSARKAAASGAPILQISAPTTHGNSGGPVLNDNMEVIGLLTFGGDPVRGQEVQGFNFAVAANTAKEFLPNGCVNEQGPADKAYRDGLAFYWGEQYKSAIPKFEEVKRLFPQHSEVEHLIQSSQQGITEGKDRSASISTGWLVVGILVVLFLFVAVIVIAAVIFFLMRRRSKTTAKPREGAEISAPPATPAFPATPRAESSRPAPPPYSPATAPKPASFPTPRVAPAVAGENALTVDLSRTIAIGPDGDTGPIQYGVIKFVSGALTGQQFEIKPEGACIGRDSSVSQIVIADPRISKRHVWIGVRDGRVVIADQDSRNGTFVNDPKSPRVKEVALNAGDTVILGESDVARFEYVK